MKLFACVFQHSGGTNNVYTEYLTEFLDNFPLVL